MKTIIEKDRFIELDLGNLVYAKWNYKKDDEEIKEKLKSQIQKNGFLINIIVRELPCGNYEVVNGNHRVAALEELGIEKVSAYNLGKVEDWKAYRIAIETNETVFSTDLSTFFSTLKELEEKYDLSDLGETMPFSEEEIKNMAENVERFDLGNDEGILEEIAPKDETETGIVSIESVFQRIGFNSIEAEKFNALIVDARGFLIANQIIEEEDFLSALMLNGGDE